MSGRFEFRRLAGLNGGGPEHPLAEVDGAAVPEGRLEVWLGPKIVGGRYFRLDLAGEAGSSRLLHGLHNAGVWPGQNWAEVYDLSLPRPLDGREGWERELVPYLRPLAAAIPPGGHLMVEYESPLWRTTQLGLLSGIPPLATPLGGLLHDLDCASSFKDWYFPEGGQEGGRKLQGNKALSKEHERGTARTRAAELRVFLAGPIRGDVDIDRRARADAERILAEL